MADAGEKVPIQETGVAAATAGEPSPLEKPAPPPASHQKKTGCVVYQHLWVSHSISSRPLCNKQCKHLPCVGTLLYIYTAKKEPFKF